MAVDVDELADAMKNLLEAVDVINKVKGPKSVSPEGGEGIRALKEADRPSREAQQ
jgi:hypothetical protein